LADLEIRPVASGWDNRLWRLGNELAVRLPMTERAPALLHKEFWWLPELAKRLPLPIPTPQHFGEPTARFPRPWIIATWVPGEPADGAEISNVHQSVDNLARSCAPCTSPRRKTHPRTLGAASPWRRSQRSSSRGSLLWLKRSTFAGSGQVWSQAIAAPPWTGPAVWLHADLHPANALVSDGTISGIVDFGDLFAESGGSPRQRLGGAVSARSPLHRPSVGTRSSRQAADLGPCRPPHP
jgi:aminoglycoside phosphotransferase (APT) family kinase protein